MKKTINVLIATAVLGMLTAAYAVCYLEQVVLCFKAGDLVSSEFSLSVGACTSFTANVYAGENAYRIDTYSVTRGGNTQAAMNPASSCDKEANVGTELGGSNSGGFDVWYLNPCTGFAMTDTNPNAVHGVNYTIASHFANHGNNCN